MTLRREVTYLGVARADPDEYVEKYGRANLTELGKMPEFVDEIRTPEYLGPLAAEVGRAGGGERVCRLEGEIEALRLVDLEAEGLGEYISQVYRTG